MPTASVSQIRFPFNFGQFNIKLAEVTNFEKDPLTYLWGNNSKYKLWLDENAPTWSWELKRLGYGTDNTIGSYIQFVVVLWFGSATERSAWKNFCDIKT